ncbi:hypothetical protein [Saccharibacillus alkalitolerans]|uniref:Uncharacterized protein n=1 Tax=Saccharibacillus alkalitolerans TaxID=2705290 RepID=A0ABX0F5Z7_9BACL|nr:hypothetical protein [Saccharibacillus alkalitolerans]NGZ75033.1 hypothetical protein [Saccharibacillus alkalitolerans]
MDKRYGDERFELINSTLGQIGTNMDNMRETVNRAASGIEKAAEGTGGLDRGLQAIRDLMSERREEGFLAEDLADLAQDLKGLREDLADLKQDLGTVREDLADLKQDLSMLKGDLAD